MNAPMLDADDPLCGCKAYAWTWCEVHNRYECPDCRRVCNYEIEKELRETA